MAGRDESSSDSDAVDSFMVVVLFKFVSGGWWMEKTEEKKRNEIFENMLRMMMTDSMKNDDANVDAATRSWYVVYRYEVPVQVLSIAPGTYCPVSKYDEGQTMRATNPKYNSPQISNLISSLLRTVRVLYHVFIHSFLKLVNTYLPGTLYSRVTKVEQQATRTEEEILDFRF